MPFNLIDHLPLGASVTTFSPAEGCVQKSPAAFAVFPGRPARGGPRPLHPEEGQARLSPIPRHLAPECPPRPLPKALLHQESPPSTGHRRQVFPKKPVPKGSVRPKGPDSRHRTL